MIIVKKTGKLFFLNKEYKCALGKSGIKKYKKEGDGSTPAGIYKFSKVYYRKDRIKKIQCSLKKIIIKKNMIWCDDIKSSYYNQQIYLPSSFSHEKLYRKENIYDIIIVINYNMNPIIKNKGSAIFLHVAKKNYNKTEGCIAVKKNELLKILNNLKRNTKIKICEN
jgi:L,D-peptidoglycan transpeptidase YkuD (ErfK/YbiS/YcfS/YnhG family)